MIARNIVYGGGAALIVGLFTPVMTVPIVGNVNLFANGSNIVAIVLLALAILSGGVALKEHERAAFWPGIAALLIVLYSFFRLEYALNQMRAAMATNLEGNPFAGLAQAAASTMQIQWGWIILIAGSVMVIYGAVKASQTAGCRAINLEDPTNKIVAGLSVLALLLLVAWDLHSSSKAGAATPTAPQIVADASNTNSNPITSPDVPSAEEARYIAQHVKIYDLKGKYYDSMFDGRVPGVDFKIKNDGDRTLNEVDIKVIFYDAQGRPIGEKTYYPVLVTSSGLGEDNTPLRPNYIWKNEDDKFYTAKKVPSEWDEGKVTATVTKIQFASSR